MLAFLSIMFIVSKAQQHEVRMVDKFSKIKMNANHGTLYLSQGPKFEIRLEGPEEILKDVITEVSREKLTIMTNISNSYGNTFEVHVTTPYLSKIALVRGDIIGKTELHSDKLQISHSGKGTLRIHSESSEMGVSQSGNGQIFLRGSTSGFTLSKSGKGNLYAKQFNVEKCSISNSGSGKCEVLCPSTNY